MRLAFFAGAVVAGVAGFSGADETEPSARLQSILVKSEAARVKAIPGMETGIKMQSSLLEAAKRGPVTGQNGVDPSGKRRTFATNDAKKEALANLTATIEQAKKMLADAKDKSKFFVPTLSDKLEVGQVGKFFPPIVSVDQVLNDKEMLVNVTRVVNSVSGGPGNGAVVFRSETVNERILIRGYPTAGIVEKRGHALTGALEVTGSQEFGSQKVFVLEPFDVEKMTPLLKVSPKKKPKKR